MEVSVQPSHSTLGLRSCQGQQSGSKCAIGQGKLSLAPCGSQHSGRVLKKGGLAAEASQWKSDAASIRLGLRRRNILRIHKLGGGRVEERWHRRTIVAAVPPEQTRRSAPRQLTVAVTTVPAQEVPVQASSKKGWFFLAGFLLIGVVAFFLVQRWKESQNRLIRKGEAPIEGPWLWKNSTASSARQPSPAEIERARQKRADQRGGRQLRPVFVAEGQLPPEGTDPEAVIEIPRNHPWATADLDEVPIDVLQRRLDQRRGPPDQAHETWKQIRQESDRLEQNFDTEADGDASWERREPRRQQAG